ncbi:cbb3-type cytochrome oxidase assembly protein CcoS [Fulvivirga sedimenti]|uniref:Cbb3-type cytochrome oxidase assembly protein CcoS n=1 Tax=Fulvivirga sedimenti TaxID=2879465 RepID=A0A9X1KV05_9BACT|nr:cbb3-type cytochrome oxidase assembly protein CcoS [Fulvivirga sedimenti]MCA6073250.1 cbb3-type cytochrome oxidase assembly protein CcoS [Fulvivirga sedimenti]
MWVLFILISVSLLVASAFLILFIWAVKSGQFDDTQTPSLRMLFDEKRKSTDSEESHKTA